jgi:hypothetical protein
MLARAPSGVCCARHGGCSWARRDGSFAGTVACAPGIVGGLIYCRTTCLVVGSMPMWLMPLEPDLPEAGGSAWLLLDGGLAVVLDLLTVGLVLGEGAAEGGESGGVLQRFCWHDGNLHHGGCSTMFGSRRGHHCKGRGLLCASEAPMVEGAGVGGVYLSEVQCVIPIDEEGPAGKVGCDMVLVVVGASQHWWGSSQGRAVCLAL